MAARPTLADIAAQAGVSVATASKALNGRSDISAGTRDRVLKIISDTGYQSPAERRESPQRPVILALLAGIDTMYSASVLHGIVDAAAAQGAETVLRFTAPSSPGSSAGDSGDELPEGCAGIIAVTFGTRGLRSRYLEAGVPIAVVDPSEAQHPAKWMNVGATNWTGARSATEHLLGLGHRRIGWIGGPVHSEPSIERLHGYRAALQSAGVPLDPAIERVTDFTVAGGEAAARELLALDDRPTAIVAANDELAIGVLDAARDLALHIPRDLSVTGFDDTPQASWSTPKLTSVRQPLVDMGRMAVTMILEAHANGTARSSSPHLQLATSLKVRESTAPPLTHEARDAAG